MGSTGDAAGAPAGAVRPLRADPAVVRFWAARVISIAGSGVTIVALPVLVYGLTGSPLVTALVSALESVPYLLFGLFAGALADRRDRRRVLIGADLISTAAVASVPLAASLHALTAGHALAVAAVLATAFVFFDAAEFGALPTLVGSDRLVAANSAVWGASTVADMAAPVAAGVALATVSPSTLLGVDGLTFAVSAVLISGITARLSLPRSAMRPALRADIAEGLRFLWREPVVRTMSLVGATQSVCGGAFLGQFVVFADRALGVRAGDVRLGLLYGGWGVGTLAATVALPRLLARTSAARITLVGVPAGAALALGLALAPSFPPALVLVIAWGAAYMLVVLNAITYRQQRTPEHLQSRVNVVGRMLSWGLGWPLGALLGGVLAATAGVRVALASATAVAALGGVLACASPLRRIEAVSARAG